MSVECKVTSEVFSQHPEIKVAFALIPNPQMYSSDEEISKAGDNIVAATASEHVDVETLKSSNMNELYKNFYKTMKLKPSKVSTPIRQAARVLKNQNYRAFNHVIDTAMFIEYTTLISFQVYDYDKIEDFLCFKIASGDEELAQNSSVAKLCKPKELILTDKSGVVHSSYHGNNFQKNINDSTENYLLRLLAIPGVNDELFSSAINQLREIFPQMKIITLDSEASQIL